MKKIITICGLILCIILLWFFVDKELVIGKNMLLHDGSIYYVEVTNGIVTLYSMEIRSKKINRLYQNRVSYFAAASVSKIDFDWILFGVDDLYEDMTHKDTIFKININTRETVFLRNGSAPIYMSLYNKILFLLPSGEEFYNGGLCVADLSKINKTKFIAISPTQRNHMVPVSNSEVIFRGLKENELFLYDIKTDKVRQLPIKNCSSPHVWRSRTDQLICGEPETGGEFLTSLDGKRIEKLPFNLYESPVIYIPEKDMLIFTVEVARYFLGYGYGPAYDLWVYDFATGKKELLSKGNGFGPGKGIYLPE